MPGVGFLEIVDAGDIVPWVVGLPNVLHEKRGGRIDLLVWNLILGKWRTGDLPGCVEHRGPGIVDSPQASGAVLRLGKISNALEVCRHGTQVGAWVLNAPLFEC